MRTSFRCCTITKFQSSIIVKIPIFNRQRTAATAAKSSILGGTQITRFPDTRCDAKRCEKRRLQLPKAGPKRALQTPASIRSDIEPFCPGSSLTLNPLTNTECTSVPGRRSSILAYTFYALTDTRIAIRWISITRPHMFGRSVIQNVSGGRCAHMPWNLKSTRVELRNGA